MIILVLMLCTEIHFILKHYLSKKVPILSLIFCWCINNDCFIEKYTIVSMKFHSMVKLVIAYD